MFKPQLTEDGSFTFFSTEFDEAFHSRYGAYLEAQKKFVEPTKLAEKAAKSPRLRLLDICYGLGYNTAAALCTIWNVNPACEVELIALESDERVPQGAITHALLNFSDPVVSLLKKLAFEYHVKEQQLTAKLLIQDARESIQTLVHQEFKADAIFLDPFSPPKCPQLWTVEFLALVAKTLTPEGFLATYSSSASVRSALTTAGLKYGPTVSVGRKSPGTVAAFNEAELPPLSDQEKEHQETRGAIPYRDPTLSDPAETIIKRRLQEQLISSKEPTSQWKKRWLRLET